MICDKTCNMFIFSSEKRVCLFILSRSDIKRLVLSICITHNRFSDSHYVYTLIQVVHTEFIKVVRTEYSGFKNLGKISQEQTVAAVVIALTSKNDNSRKVGMKPWLKRRKNLGFYENL